MADQAKYTVTLEFETDGANAEINNLRKLQEAVDGVARKGGIGEQSQVKLSKALHSTGVAAGDASSGIKKSEDSIISLRYANYDLANTLFATSAAITAVGVASVAAFAQQESSFTEVERIAGGSVSEIQNLREELRAMSTEIPVAFGELSNIASLGAALDIPADQLDEFTKSVAVFAATTGITVEAAATGFGKLAAYLKIPEEEFDALGSAILRAGNISVATEEQVLKFAQALALPGARIGFTTDQVVALGATLASFGNINVEGAGSALNRVTKNIERALAENGEALDTWAATAGMSAEAFRVAWGSDVSGTFNQVIKGLSGNIEGLVGNLDALGIRNIRDQRIIEALALNYGKYNEILGETTNAWREGTYMNEAYGLVLDDLMSKWQIFVNALTNFAASVGQELAPAIGTLLDLTTKTLVALSDFASSPFGGFVVRTVASLAAMAAAWTAIRGAVALATATTYAFSFATRSIGGVGIISGMKSLRDALLGVGVGANAGAVGVLNLRKALKALGTATIIVAVLQYAAEWMFNTAEAAQNLGNVLIWMSNIGQTVFNSLARSLAQVSAPLATVFALMGADNTFTRVLRGMGTSLRDWGAGLSKAQDDAYQFNSTLEDFSSLDDFTSNLDKSSSGLGNMGGSAAQAAREVRTLVDYSNDLAQVWSRAFEIRFSGSQTLDTITSSFISIREAADEAAKRIRDLNNDIRSLSSDIDIQEYFLSIAVEYGDTKRAAAIEADLAKKRAELADKSAELQKEQDKANKTLVGNSKAAIDNRKQITDLVQQYQAHIQALASSGMSQARLAEATKRLKADFLAQATQLGYNRKELQIYAKAFDDVAVAIAKVPRNITVKANTNPAIQAFNEYEAALNKARANAGKGISLGKIQDPNSSYGMRESALKQRIAGMIAYQKQLIAAKNFPGVLSVDKTLSKLQALLRSGNFWSGGFTGPGGKYEPAGVVHRGEYVIPKQDVNQATGLPYADALGRLMSGIPGMASGGPTVGSGGTLGTATVALTPGTIQAIAQATGKVIVLDGQVIAESSEKQYAHQTTVGAY